MEVAQITKRRKSYLGRHFYGMAKCRETLFPPAEMPFSQIAPKSVHFVGILGIGVSSLAQWFLTCHEHGRMGQKWAVSGSDVALNANYQELKKVGIRTKIGHKRGNIPGKCGLIIHSNAIRPDNPELKEARRRKIPILSYPEAVGELTRFYKTISVSGMHGKSTTTAMAGLTLVKAKLDPTIIVGTRLKELNGNFRAGDSEYLVLEADEYKDAFLNYSPTFAIVANLDKEHFDYFKNIGKIKKSFIDFFSRVRKGGILILNRDNKILFSLNRKIKKIVKLNNLRVKWYSLRDKEAQKIKKYIKLPGQHNLSNALAVFCLSKFVGISEKIFLSSISEYNGSWRRMEYRGEYHVESSKYRVSRNKNTMIQDTGYKIPVYDDYAHHPTEIKATLQAFREKFSDSELICVFQPHQTERLKTLFKEFKTAFDFADKTIIMPIYKVAGRESADNPNYNSEALVRSIQKLKPSRKVFYIKDPKNIKNALNVLLSNHSFPCPIEKSAINPRQSASYPRPPAGEAGKSAVVIMMGAGDIVNYTDELIN